MKMYDLCGQWMVRQAGNHEEVPAAVPGCIHTDLLNAGKIDDPYYRDNELEQMWIGVKLVSTGSRGRRTPLSEQIADQVSDEGENATNNVLVGMVIEVPDPHVELNHAMQNGPDNSVATDRRQNVGCCVADERYGETDKERYGNKRHEG